MHVNIGRCIRASKKTLLDGINSRLSKKFLNIQSIVPAIDGNIAKLPLSCFNRTKSGEIILYRGLHNISYIPTKAQCALSNAATKGIKRGNIFQGTGIKKSKKGMLSLIKDFVSFTQGGNDPILHTTSSKEVALRSFANVGESDAGVLIEYHVPKEYLSKKGYLSHLGEDEISFLHSIPKRFVKKITKLFTPHSANTDIVDMFTPATMSKITQETLPFQLPPAPPEIRII